MVPNFSLFFFFSLRSRSQYQGASEVDIPDWYCSETDLALMVHGAARVVINQVTPDLGTLTCRKSVTNWQFTIV